MDMPADAEKLLSAYEKDSRIECQYGEKCYQKNPAHHNKYKHPPKISQTNKNKNQIKKGIKRKTNTKNGPLTKTIESKFQKIDDDTKIADFHKLSASSDDDEVAVESKQSEKVNSESSDESSNDSEPVPESPVKKKQLDTPKTSPKKDNTHKTITNIVDESSDNLSSEEKLISELFLVKMPNDFYTFYEFCSSLDSQNPHLALQAVDLVLVGPFDVLSGKINKPKDDKDIYLRHWRYFYDPPEFQTILKGNDKDGLHYGYWRDEPTEQPSFVAKNSANKDYKIVAFGSNIFAAVLAHIEESLKKANPFTTGKIAKISRLLKTFAKEKNISLEKKNSVIKTRERKVVAKTFHGAGIVVKYDTKTQLGYRTLAATDNEFRKILKNIENPASDEDKIKNLSSLEEIVRLAIIAADECDFGTPLELGHDLFVSGIECLEKTTLRMLTMAYNLLQRNQFTKIAEVHMKNRKKGSQLSIL